jgi:hypothetical protein
MQATRKFGGVTSIVPMLRVETIIDMPSKLPLSGVAWIEFG